MLAELARGRLRAKIPALQRALDGPFRPHHAFLITQILAKIEFLEATIATLTDEIERQLSPLRQRCSGSRRFRGGAGGRRRRCSWRRG